MKMMSKTSITSTSGVTLICEMVSVAEELWSNAIASSLAQEVTFRDVQKFGREGFHLGGEDAHLAGEAVVHDDRGNGGGEADGGRDQRLGDARRDRLDAGGRRRREAAEGGHDAPPRAEEPDERRRAGGRGEEREPALEAGHLLSASTDHCPLHVLNASELVPLFLVPRVAALAARQSLQLLVAAPEDLRNGALLQIDARGLDGREVLGVPEDVDEAFRLAPGTPHLDALRERDPPAADRERHQDDEHRAHHGPRVDDHVEDRVLVRWQRRARLRRDVPEQRR